MIAGLSSHKFKFIYHFGIVYYQEGLSFSKELMKKL